MDELIDKIEIKLEHILESDPRTMKNPDCECGSIYDSVYEVLKMVRQLEKLRQIARKESNMIDSLKVLQELELCEPYAKNLSSVTVPSNVILDALAFLREQHSIKSLQNESKEDVR